MHMHDEYSIMHMTGFVNLMHNYVCCVYRRIYHCFSVQWMCPSQTPSDCVLDMTESVHRQLVGVGRGGDVTWWMVREGGGEDGEGVSVEDPVIFKKAEITSELRRCGYGKCNNIR